MNRDTPQLAALFQHERMPTLSSHLLQQLVGSSTEPMLLVQIDSPDWPVLLANAAFESLARGKQVVGRPFPDVFGPLIGREMILEASAALRTHKEAALPVDIRSREYLMTLLPVADSGENDPNHFAIYLRTAGHRVPVAGGRATSRALASATRRVRDLSGEDPVTGLLNDSAFRRVLLHDWAVAAREGSVLGLVAFRIEDFDAYLSVFGRHGADSCQKRVAKIIGRFLRRASDVTARIDGEGGGHFVVLAHGSSQENLSQFAAHIAQSVRALGLHHPRAQGEKFVNVCFDARTFEPREGGTAARALARLLESA